MPMFDEEWDQRREGDESAPLARQGSDPAGRRHRRVGTAWRSIADRHGPALYPSARNCDFRGDSQWAWRCSTPFAVRSGWERTAFFPVWLKAVGNLDAAWIGIITALPAVSRFTALPFFLPALPKGAGRCGRSSITLTAFATAIGLLMICSIRPSPSSRSMPRPAARGRRRPHLPMPMRCAASRYAAAAGLAAFVVGALACGLSPSTRHCGKHLHLGDRRACALMCAGHHLGLDLSSVRAAADTPVHGGQPTAARSRLPRRYPRDLGAGAGQPRRRLHHPPLCSIAWQHAGFGENANSTISPAITPKHPEAGDGEARQNPPARQAIEAKV